MSLVLATPHGVIADSQGTDTSNNTYSTMDPTKVLSDHNLAMGAVGSWAGVEAMHEAITSDRVTHANWESQTRSIRDYIRREMERITGDRSISSSPRYIGTLKERLFIINHDLGVTWPKSSIAAIGEGHKVAEALIEEKLHFAAKPLPEVLADTMAVIAREFTRVGGPFLYAAPGEEITRLERTSTKPGEGIYKGVPTHY